ncbi:MULTISPECIES: hypothetical protein [unclassified Methylocaldum]|jgi:hypothetical protein|uniref:hypothetical protein n=1 Tax=unclassified Methylocaldum TaxID=2622260 RepID=UPI00098AB7D6|nr:MULTISPECIES: hypothetical protein [unclassified Methylocaldum]MBP1150560.1 hypothetical protein [Methylocaldum sp. RMAD-M]
MKRVVVHIDRLVLKGFRHEDRHAVAAGLHAELTRLLADPVTVERLANIGNATRVPVGNVPLEHGAKPQSIGTQTAQAIARSIKS